MSLEKSSKIIQLVNSTLTKLNSNHTVKSYLKQKLSTLNLEKEGLPYHDDCLINEFLDLFDIYDNKDHIFYVIFFVILLLTLLILSIIHFTDNPSAKDLESSFFSFNNRKY